MGQENDGPKGVLNLQAQSLQSISYPSNTLIAITTITTLHFIRRHSTAELATVSALLHICAGKPMAVSASVATSNLILMITNQLHSQCAASLLLPSSSDCARAINFQCWEQIETAKFLRSCFMAQSFVFFDSHILCALFGEAWEVRYCC